MTTWTPITEACPDLTTRNVSLKFLTHLRTAIVLKRRAKFKGECELGLKLVPGPGRVNLGGGLATFQMATGIHIKQCVLNNGDPLTKFLGTFEI